MSFPSTTNIDGSNPGPNSATPDTPQSSIGNVWKFASIPLTLTPLSVAATTVAEQTFTVTGLLKTDLVVVNDLQAAQSTLGIVGSRVTAAGVLGISWMNTGAIATPTSGSFIVGVIRVQPNWVAPATGSAIDY